METEDEITRTHHELEKDTFSEKSEEVVLPPEEDHREVEATEAQKVIEYEITEKLELTAPTDEDHKISETIKDTTEIKPDTHFPEVTSEEYFEQEALAETQKHEQTEFQEYSEQTAKTLTETSMQSIQTVSYSEIQSEEHLISEYTSESRKIFEDHEVPLTVEPADIPAEVEKSPDIEGLEKSPLDQDLLVETEELSKVQHEPDTVDIEMKGPYLDQDLIEETIEEITRTQPEFGNEEFSEKSEDDGALPDEEDHREVEAIETQKVMEYEITEKLETTAPADDKQEISEMIKDTTEIKPDTHFPEITSEEYFEQEGLTETQKHKQTEFQEFSQQITETLTETSMQSIQTVSYSDIKSEEHLISEYTSESRKEFEDQEVPLTVEPADIPADEAEVEKSPGTEGLEKSPLDQDRLMETEEEITRTKREFEEDKFSEESQEDVESSSEKEQREKEAIDTQRFKEYKVVEKLEPSAPSEEEQELSGVVQVTTETRPEPDEVDFKEVTSEEHSEEIICTSTTLQETFIEESIQEKQDVSVTETDDKFDTVPERDQFLEEHIESTDKASVETMPWQSQEQVEIIRGKEEVSFDEHGSLGESREHISDFDTLQDDAGQDAMVSQQDFDEMATGRVKDMEVDEIIMEPFSFTQKVTVIEHLVTYESPDESGEPADGETESFSEESEDEIIDHTSGFKPTEQPKAEVYHYEMETEDEKVKHEIDILQAEVTEKSPTEVEEIVPIAQTASHISEHVYLEESSREIITVTEQTTTGPCGLEHEGDQVSALEEVSESDTLIDAEQYIDRKETFTLEERSRDVKSPLMKEVIEDKKQETEDETEDIFMDTFIDRKERFLVESRDVLDDSGPAGKGDDAGKDKVDHVIETVHPPDLQYVQQALEEATSDTLQSPVDGMFLALHPPLVPTSSTEVQDRSGTPSDFETDELDAVQEREAIQYTDNEQPVSPTDFSVGSQNTMEESYIVGAADDEMEPEGRITADMSEQIFIEQTIEARKTGADQCYPLDEDDKEERPPSPSEYTLIASQDQDRLARALGVLTAEDASSSNESDDDRPPSPTEYTLIASQDQEALGRAMGLDYPRGDDYIDDEKTFSQDADQLMRADVIGQYQDLLGDQLDEEITCGPNSTQSSEQALMQTLDHSIDNNTMSTLSSEFGDQQQPVEPSAPPPAFNETEEISIIASSYECIYEGMSVETEMHKQQTMEQVIEVGDHFDTKQPDLHLQPIGHSSSYEQLYVEVEEGYQGDSGERLGVEDFHADKAAMLEEKLSSSSSEVAQLEDMLTDQAKGEEDVYYEDPDDSDGDSVDSPTASGGDGDHVQSTRLMMKKEIHKKTVIGMDGNQETFIKEESQIQQDNEPPEELRGSMQEIIDQFMESEPQVPQIDAKLLEDDV